MTATSHNTDSSLREQVIEHLFVGELLKSLWCNNVRDIEVLKPEVDRGGYDIVIESGNIIRHVQLKTSFRNATTSSVDISRALGGKPSGCVIWIYFDLATLELGPFRWFGDGPGRPLPDLGSKVARQSRGKKNYRPNMRVINKGKFEEIETIEELRQRLFGQIKSSA